MIRLFIFATVVALVSAYPGIEDGSMSVNGADEKQQCVFTSRNYAVGDVWYSRLGQRGALQCVACLCQEGGKINCTIHQCGGQECSDPETAINNECCVHCSKEPKGPSMMTRNGSPPSSFLPSDPVPTSALSSSSSLMAGSGLGDAGTTTCLHNGNVYRHKERFTSASIGLKPDNANQCVQCVCQAGMVLCQLKDCPKPDCDEPIRIRDDCCPVCPDPAGRMDEVDNSPIIINQQPEGGGKMMEDCISGGRYHMHGTSWHPVMGPFGPMDCVNCNCRSGKIECRRLECPTRPNMSCDRPVKIAGRCCPVCPLESESQHQGMMSSSPVTREAPGIHRSAHHSHSDFSSGRSSQSSSSSSMKTSAGGGIRNLGPSSSSSSNTRSRSSSSIPSGSNQNLCLPNDYDSLVYRAQGGENSESEFIQYIFQQVVNGQGIEHHMWMLQSTTTTHKVQTLTKDQAEKLKQRFRFVLLGATNSQHLQRFTKREKRLKPKCLPASGCPKKIRKLERNLTLKEVTSRKDCLPIEIEAKL